ncbi:MAG: porin [Gemmatimonadetes bacterium]|nr:porin [Gemmatimonadota bacterium]MBK7925053.1 porin [Gemmatimonadota bacterium]MBK9067830.1 porin [Gemmatimonadota bacterium]
MKRSALLFGALMLGAASGANAQALSMQMSNGWTFGFAGNVNIFAMYQSVSSSNNATGSPGQLVTGADTKGLYYGTGLLPAFATFTAKGKEGNTDLGVQFGFAPQVQCGGNAHDCFGAQIDMRQVFMTVGGSWGTITAGKELGIYQRSNILNDQTLFGVGGGGIAPGGTTLGRIGFGYVYPNFVPQFSYSSPAGKTTSFNIGLMEPSTFGAYTELTIPRLEAEVSFKAGNNLSVFVGGTAQNGKDPIADESKTAVGASGGLTYKTGTFSIHGSGYYGKGISTTLMFNANSQSGSELTKSYGYYGQLTFTPANSKMTLAGSFGSSFLADDGNNFKTENSLVSGGIYYQATKSLKIVGEGDYMWSKDKEGSGKNKAFTGAFGMMLFY